eukprot:Ihof_evm1s142 gene=Ihof_evmTU1s142
MPEAVAPGGGLLGPDNQLDSEKINQCAEILSLKQHYNADMARYSTWKTLLQTVRKHNVQETTTILEALMAVETLWARPGPQKLATLRRSIQNRMWAETVSITESILRRFAVRLDCDRSPTTPESGPHFEVLIVQNQNDIGNAHCDIALEMGRLDKKGDELQYATVTVSSFEDAIIALLYNHDIQAVVFSTDFAARSKPPVYRSLMTVNGEDKLQGLQRFIDTALESLEDGIPITEVMARTALEIRPELDLYFVCDYGAMGKTAQNTAALAKRVFAAMDDHVELHLCILGGVKDRVATPFFDALVAYSKRPVCVFHALALSRGQSIRKSRWIQGLPHFYGSNLFKAESSSTCGGLDSLLDPQGTLKQAQAKAAKAFQAQHTFFVTNGTSTANKICNQALLQPGDICIIDRDCHKSHHYGIVLSGAMPCYVDAYPIHKYSMYGAVPIRALKKALLDYKEAGLLHKVKLVILTNCTFDGIVYNVRRVMEELLAIKPDLTFLWDEAWFAYATFNPIMRNRTGMGVAKNLEADLETTEFRMRYLQFQSEFGPIDGAPMERLL